MTMTKEPVHAWEFVLSEANGTRARENITVMQGQKLEAGTVLGLLSSGAASSAAGGSNVGNGTMGTVTVTSPAQVGAYVLTVTAAAANAGTFSVVAPDGSSVGTGTVAVAFSAGGLAFTLADGATDFAVNDTFTITVTKVPGHHVPYDNAASDGSQAAVAVLGAYVDSTDRHTAAAVIAREAEVIGALLGWGTNDSTGITAGKADLVALQIRVR